MKSCGSSGRLSHTAWRSAGGPVAAAAPPVTPHQAETGGRPQSSGVPTPAAHQRHGPAHTQRHTDTRLPHTDRRHLQHTMRHGPAHTQRHTDTRLPHTDRRHLQHTRDTDPHILSGTRTHNSRTPTGDTCSTPETRTRTYSVAHGHTTPAHRPTTPAAHQRHGPAHTQWYTDTRHAAHRPATPAAHQRHGPAHTQRYTDTQLPHTDRRHLQHTRDTDPHILSGTRTHDTQHTDRRHLQHTRDTDPHILSGTRTHNSRTPTGDTCSTPETRTRTYSVAHGHTTPAHRPATPAAHQRHGPAHTQRYTDIQLPHTDRRHLQHTRDTDPHTLSGTRTYNSRTPTGDTCSTPETRTRTHSAVHGHTTPAHRPATPAAHQRHGPAHTQWYTDTQLPHTDRRHLQHTRDTDLHILSGTRTHDTQHTDRRHLQHTRDTDPHILSGTRTYNSRTPTGDTCSTPETRTCTYSTVHGHTTPAHRPATPAAHQRHGPAHTQRYTDIQLPHTDRRHLQHTRDTDPHILSGTRTHDSRTPTGDTCSTPETRTRTYSVAHGHTTPAHRPATPAAHQRHGPAHTQWHTDTRLPHTDRRHLQHTRDTDPHTLSGTRTHDSRTPTGDTCSTPETRTRTYSAVHGHTTPAHRPATPAAHQRAALTPDD